jgi:peptidoglycan/LPS O-acetylase OafA/YrhL
METKLRYSSFVRGATAIAAGRANHRKRQPMLLLVLLIVLILAAAPTWPYSRGWGYYPSGTLGTILLVVVILVLLGRVPL